MLCGPLVRPRDLANTGSENRFAQDRAFELIRLIYEAASDESRWATFLASFATWVGARAGALLIRGLPAGRPAVYASFGHLEEDVRSYADHYAATDPWYLAATRLTEGMAATSSELCPPQEMEASAAFREFYVPRRFWHGMSGLILHSQSAHSIIAMLRSREDGPFEKAEVSALQLLMPHLRMAAVLQAEISSLRTRQAVLTTHLDYYWHGLALIDRERRLLYANAFASEVTSRRDGLQIDDGRLVAAAPEEDAALLETTRVVAANRTSRIHRMSISRQSSPIPYRLMMLLAGASQTFPLSEPHPVMAVVIIDPAHASGPEPEALRDFFSLTAAQARIVSLLAQGLSLEELTQKLGVSVATVRTHLRNAFSKTGTSRQGELVALILRTVPLNGRPDIQGAGQ